MYGRMNNNLIHSKILLMMKKATYLKLIVGAGVFVAALSIDLSNALGLNSASAQTENGSKNLRKIGGQLTCPNGQTIYGDVCIMGDDECTSDISC